MYPLPFVVLLMDCPASLDLAAYFNSAAIGGLVIAGRHSLSANASPSGSPAPIGPANSAARPRLSCRTRCRRPWGTGPAMQYRPAIDRYRPPRCGGKVRWSNRSAIAGSRGIVSGRGWRAALDRVAVAAWLAARHSALRSRSFTTRSWGSPGLLT
jgi:hypothetical protein